MLQKVIVSTKEKFPQSKLVCVHDIISLPQQRFYLFQIFRVMFDEPTFVSYDVNYFDPFQYAEGWKWGCHYEEYLPLSLNSLLKVQ